MKNKYAKTLRIVAMVISMLCCIMGMLLIGFDEIANGILLICWAFMLAGMLGGFAAVIQLLQDIKDSIAANSAPADPEEIPEI